MRATTLATLVALAAATPLPAAGPRPNGEQQLAGYIQGRVAGEPTSCIPQWRDTNSHTIYGLGVVFDVGATRYVMRFKDGCDFLTENTLFSTQTPTTQLCEGDAAQVYDNSPSHIFYGTCIFGKFVPYKKG